MEVKNKDKWQIGYFCIAPDKELIPLIYKGLKQINQKQ